MSDLSKPALAHFRHLLEQRRAALLAVDETNQDAAAVVELDQSRVGRLSRMDALQAQAMSQEVERRRELELRQIQAALARIESGDYGYCLSCDEPIDPRRLAIDPAATICIECAEERG